MTFCRTHAIVLVPVLLQLAPRPRLVAQVREIDGFRHASLKARNFEPFNLRDAQHWRIFASCSSGWNFPR